MDNQTHKRVFDLSKTEVRESSDGGFRFRGYAAVFNSLSEDLGGWREMIAPGAFTRTLKVNPDVRFLINHDESKILGRTPKTLKVEEDQHGLSVDAQLPNTTYANDLAESLSRGDISQMSFRFRAVKSDWERRDNQKIEVLKDVDLLEVSAVTFPAYPESHGTLSQRMLDSAFSIMDEVRAGKQISASNREVITNVIKELQQLLDVTRMEELITDPKKLKIALREREFGFH